MAFWKNRHRAAEVVLKETLDKLASANAALLMLANACDDVGVRHFDTDTISPQVEAMQACTAVARSVLSKTL